jgi:hypothetical protein
VFLLVEVSEHACLVLFIIKPSIFGSGEASLISVLNFILNSGSVVSLSVVVAAITLVLSLNLVLLLGGLLLLATLALVVVVFGLSSLRSRFLVLRLFNGAIIFVTTVGLSLAVTLSGA